MKINEIISNETDQDEEIKVIVENFASNKNDTEDTLVNMSEKIDDLKEEVTEYKEETALFQELVKNHTEGINAHEIHDNAEENEVKIDAKYKG